MQDRLARRVARRGRIGASLRGRPVFAGLVPRSRRSFVRLRQLRRNRRFPDLGVLLRADHVARSGVHTRLCQATRSAGVGRFYGFLGKTRSILLAPRSTEDCSLKFRAIAAVLAGGLALTVPAFAATNTANHLTNAMSAHSMTINLGAQNGSKQDGQAFLNDTPNGLRVKVQVKNEPAGASEPAHIHQGTCAKLNPAPWKPLTNVVGGVSVTTLSGLTLA